MLPAVFETRIQYLYALNKLKDAARPLVVLFCAENQFDPVTVGYEVMKKLTTGLPTEDDLLPFAGTLVDLVNHRLDAEMRMACLEECLTTCFTAVLCQSTITSTDTPRPCSH